MENAKDATDFEPGSEERGPARHLYGVDDPLQGFATFATKLRLELDSAREKAAQSGLETAAFQVALDGALSQAKEQASEPGHSPAPVQLRTPSTYRGGVTERRASSATSPALDGEPPQQVDDGEAVQTPALSWTEAETLGSQAQELLKVGEITQQDFDHIQAGLATKVATEILIRWGQCARRAEADKSRALARERYMAEAAAREHATAVADIRGQHARAFEVMWMELHQHMEARTTEHKARLVRARQHEKKQTEHQRSVEEVLSEERAKHARELASLTGVHWRRRL